ncbi:amino acid ABC transporter substrate-binding protein, PAAT family [Longilinea arvoryzae]|uniref:Amino acid ABC transporter substrate-binding protein, PAAT family n=1 Tax=Longilinea arvoryzae TaxID=360412 RepID=A0A0S7B9U2_9CHLR|nr:basic amino acid ABC transporter substrate-binding protein [Longilinea arvoryzae]GAP14110.1 amino acid ABC transporter substrate-binding protein, PAAT family [Longilinea arvoryzae]
MKRTTLFVLSVLVILATLLSACGTPKTKVTVATDATFPPFEYVDEKTQQITGFDVELIRLVADKAGLEISIENTPFDSVTAGISQCQFDIAIAAITITDERKQNMLFSDPYINAGQIVVVRKDETAIKSYADLNGKTVAAQLGTTGAVEAEKIPNVTFKPYDSYDLAFLDLQNAQIDAVIVDYPTALGFIAKNPDKLMTTGDVFTDESYGIAVCKSKPELVDKINAALKALKDDGKIKELEDKYLAAQ